MPSILFFGMCLWNSGSAFSSMASSCRSAGSLPPRAACRILRLGFSSGMLRKLIRGQAVQHAAAPAILAPDYAALTYLDLDAAVSRIGAALERLGLTKSARLALACSNGPESAVAFLGI